MHIDEDSEGAIAGANEPAYTVGTNDEGETISGRVTFTDDAGNREEVTSAPTDRIVGREAEVSQQRETENSPAAGQPTINGTPSVGETLTANVSGVSDPNGMGHANFTYQWLRNDGAGDSAISGATDATYTVSNDDVGNQIKVRVSFTDDDGFDETVTSNSVYVQPPQPLYGGFDASSVPDSHYGSASFTFEIHFSEEPDLNSADMRDHVLTVTGGDVAGASRKTQGSNIRWVITLQPDGDVTIVLPVTTDCGHVGAVCTGDGRMLSNRTSITVPGQAEDPPQDEQTTEELPQAPTGLAATLNSDGSITLTWAAPDDGSVTGYQVLRRKPQEGEGELTVYVSDTGSTATTYTDTNTDLDTRYVYRVKARNPHGIGPWSNFARIDKE